MYDEISKYFEELGTKVGSIQYPSEYMYSEDKEYTILLRQDKPISEEQMRIAESVIAEKYKLKKVTVKIDPNPPVFQPDEILDMILNSKDFESTLTELMDLENQRYYKINLSNTELDIDIYALNMNSEIFKKIKPHKDRLRFNLHSKNTLNIEER